MTAISRVIILAALLSVGVPAFAQKSAGVPQSIPDSLDYMWKQIEMDFTSLAEAMPEAKWTFKPSQGAFKDVRTFAEQVKHALVPDAGGGDRGDERRQPAAACSGPLRGEQSTGSCECGRVAHNGPLRSARALPADERHHPPDQPLIECAPYLGWNG